MLVLNLLELISRTMSRSFDITPDAIEQLKQYPGNVRELRDSLFIAATQSSHGSINADTVVEGKRGHSDYLSAPLPAASTDTVIRGKWTFWFFEILPFSRGTGTVVTIRIC